MSLYSFMYWSVFAGFIAFGLVLGVIFAYAVMEVSSKIIEYLHKKFKEWREQ